MSVRSGGLRRRLRARAPLPLGAIALVGGGVLALSTTAFFRVSLLPAMGADLGLAPAMLSLVTTVFATGRLAADLPAGRLADRVAPARALVAAAVGVGVGSLLFASARTSPALFAGAVVLGASSALANTTGMTFFSTSVTAAQRGRSLALFSAALLGGQALGPAFGGLLAALGTWRTAEAIAGGVGLATALALLLAPDPAGARRRDPEPRGAAAHAIIASRRGERETLYAVSFVSFFALGAMPQTFVGVIGADAFGFSATTIGLALGLGGLFRFVGALIGGVIADRVSRKAALVPGLATMAGGVALLAVRSPVVWLVAIVLLSVGSFGISVATAMLGDRTHAAVTGRRFGTFRLIGDLGLMSGPLAAGFLYANVSPAAAVLAVAGLLAASAALSAVVLAERGEGPIDMEVEP